MNSLAELLSVNIDPGHCADVTFHTSSLRYILFLLSTFHFHDDRGDKIKCRLSGAHMLPYLVKAFGFLTHCGVCGQQVSPHNANAANSSQQN